MDLVTAFATIAPIPRDDPALAAARAEAAEVLVQELRSNMHWAGARATKEEVEDAIQDTLMRLVKGGPRERLASDEMVRHYLRRALKNNLLSILRMPKRQPLPPDLEAAGPETAPPDVDAPDEERALPRESLREVVNALRERIAPAIAASMRAEFRAGFLGAVDEMVRIVMGEIRFADLLPQEFREATESAEKKRRANAIYQRHFRARRRLIAGLDALRASGKIEPVLAERLERLIEEMRRRGTAGNSS
jgi:DNA-directed RNA polymerase specialized sigma24 family protein